MALMADRDSASGSLAGSGSSGGTVDATSLRGPGLLLRERRRFAQDPLRSWNRLNDRVPELLGLEPSEDWSMEKYARELVGFGHQKLAKRMFYLLCKMHREAKRDNTAALKGLIAQGLKFVEKTVLDNGAQEMAACLLPYEDPATIADRASPASGSADPFSGLCDPEESALGLRYLTDMVSFGEARQKRLKGGKGGGKSKEKAETEGGEAGPKKKKN